MRRHGSGLHRSVSPLYGRWHGQRALARALWAVTLTTAALPAGAGAAVMRFGSPLAVAATKNTATNLKYAGTGGVGHVHHDGADTALWNATMPPGARSSAPTGGQITAIRLEGCAERAPGGPSPLTQIHFQALTPMGGGGAHVDVASQAFAIPTCGAPNATRRTVTSYHPTNFCVSRGDIVDFNDEGGFDPNHYPSGVPYEVIGTVPGAVMDSFIADNGTNNGATFLTTDVAASDGFARNPHEELLLQSTLATGVDATPLCPGGLYGEPGMPGGKPALDFGQATTRVKRGGYVALSLYCDLLGRPCTGTIALYSARATLGSAPLFAPRGRVSTVRVRLSTPAIAELRARGAMNALVVALLEGAETASHAMRLQPQ